MINVTNRLVAGLSALFLALGSGNALAGDKRMPEKFALDRLQGGALGAEDVKGKVVILQFFASWCVGCGSVMGELAPLVQGQSGARFLPISVDESEGDARQYFKRQTKSVQPLVEIAAYDKDAKLATALGVEALPAVYVVDATGKVITSMSGHPNAEQLKTIKNLVEGKGAAH